MADPIQPSPAAPDHGAGQAAALADARLLARRALLVGLGRLALSIVLVLSGLAGLPAWGPLAGFGAAIAAVIAGGVWLDWLDVRRRICVRLADYHRLGLERMAGRWGRHGDTGVAEAGAAHPYAHDLTVVGERSLFTLLDTSASRAGRDLLLAWLLDRSGEPTPGQDQEVRWLSHQHAWRAGLHAAGVAPSPGGDGLAAWLAQPVRPPAWLRVAAWAVRLVLPIAVGTAAVRFGGNDAFQVFLILLPVAILVDSRALRWLRTLGSREELLAMLAAERRLVARLAQLPLDERAPESLRALTASAVSAGAALAEAEGIAEALAKRRNPLWAHVVGAVLCAEWWNLARLRRWAQRHRGERVAWLAAAARGDALACLATYVAEQGGCWPTWNDAGAMLETDDLAHPLLPATRRVGNDLRLAPGALLVVTGANASGKSTFLRACLLAVLLARCGATVPARALRLRRMRLATVMGVHDDVIAGMSRFQAEVARLKLVLDLARSPGLPVLVALDEPLSGTNSAERHLGTHAVALALRAHAAAVLISTHDLALAALRDQDPEAVQVVHFSDRAAETGGGYDIAFDYRMRPGVLETTNALRIMRLAGLPVPAESGDGAADPPARSAAADK